MSDDLVTWLRRRVRERLYLAQHAVELGNAAEWHEQSSGVLLTGPPAEGDAWHGTWPMGDSSLTRLMEANDPRDTIARCEAEVAILDEHAPADCTAYGERLCRRCIWDDDEPPNEDGHRWVIYPCRTVRLLAAGYQFRPGYREQEWKP